MKSRLRIKHRPAAIIETAVRKPIQRWSAARKRDIVLRVLRGGLIEAVSRQVAAERRWCTRHTPKLLCDGRLATDGIRASGCQHPVQRGHADCRLGQLGRDRNAH
jgi:hypothetical protein